MFAIDPQIAEPALSATAFPFVRQLFKPQYCQFPPLHFPRSRFTVRSWSPDELLETWDELRRETKERLMLTLYLLALKTFKDAGDEHKQLLVDLFWMWRRWFIGETDREKLRWHFGRCLTVNDPTWPRKVDLLGVFEFYNCATSPLISDTGYKILRSFQASGACMIYMIGALCEFRRFATNIDRLNRKLRACRIMLTFWDIRLLEMFENGNVDDRYLKGLKEIYGSAWLDTAIGPLRECKSCSTRRIALLTCGLCKQESIRKKARYCSKECQIVDWQQHRKIHKSKYDHSKPSKDNRDYIEMFEAPAEQ